MMLNSLARDFEDDYDDLMYDLKEYIKDNAKMSSFLSRLKLPDFYREYNSKTKNYFFWKYENHLRTSEQPVCGEMPFEELNDNSGTYKITIEHITSQKPLNGLTYEKQDDDFKENYLDSIGNLTIDPNSSNASKGNEVWLKKNEKYFSKAPFKTQLELSEFIDNDEKVWGKKIINKREQHLVDFAKKYWKISS